MKFIRRKTKLNLLDNYVAIYRVLYHCKRMLSAQNYTSNENMVPKLQKLCDQTLDLKTKYEKAFVKLNMVDDSFILLKQQLSACKGYNTPRPPKCTLKEISDSVEIIEKDYANLKL